MHAVRMRNLIMGRPCRSSLLLGVLIIGTLAASCAPKRVNDLLADPSRYRDREVRLTGQVVDSYSIAGRGVYRIEDETGRLWVMSNRGVPRKGARVTVTGTLREGVNIGALSQNLPADIGSGLVLVETSHKAES